LDATANQRHRHEGSPKAIGLITYGIPPGLGASGRGLSTPLPLELKGLQTPLWQRPKTLMEMGRKKGKLFVPLVV